MFVNGILDNVVKYYIDQGFLKKCMLIRKFIILLLFLSSCVNDKKINSNLIDNPLTVDGLSKNIKVPQLTINSPIFDFGEVNEGKD